MNSEIKYCEDCKWYIAPQPRFIRTNIPAACRCPHIGYAANLVSRGNYIECINARLYSTYCGIEGKYWETNE